MRRQKQFHLEVFEILVRQHHGHHEHAEQRRQHHIKKVVVRVDGGSQNDQQGSKEDGALSRDLVLREAGHPGPIHIAGKTRDEPDTDPHRENHGKSRRDERREDIPGARSRR